MKYDQFAKSIFIQCLEREYIKPVCKNKNSAVLIRQTVRLNMKKKKRNVCHNRIIFRIFINIHTIYSMYINYFITITLKTMKENLVEIVKLNHFIFKYFIYISPSPCHSAFLRTKRKTWHQPALGLRGKLWPTTSQKKKRSESQQREHYKLIVLRYACHFFTYI